MKKITLYLHILMFLLITACSNEDIIVPTPPSGADGQTCEVSFWASIPETSSASRGDLGEATATSVETLSLLVFDAESGLYLYKSDATLTSRTLDNGIHKGQYKARLQLSDKSRIIHFVANAGDVAFQANELAVLSQLKKENNQDAYWQKATVSSITGTITAEGTYTNVQAPGITDTTIKLVRNFARVTLTAAANSGFDLAGFVLVNTATKGTVAPYMRQAKNGSYFPDYDTENDANGSAMTKYEALLAAGYAGVQPSDATIDPTVPEASSDRYTTGDKYLYERTQEEDEDPVFIIAKRNMGTNQYRYYKIDIMKVGGTGEKDDYYKILRNFSYDITINSVEGDGYENPADAAQATASNNLSASLELKDLTNIAYGDERLFVSKTEIVWTSSARITFKYKYEKGGSGSNDEVTSLILGEAKNSSGVVCNNYDIINGTTDAEGYSTISITHTGLPTSGYKEQEVTIKAGTLMRSVNLILINPYQSEVGCDDQSGLNTVPKVAPEIPLTVGEEVYVYFSMPAGLPESIFPLTFILAPEAHSITPNGANMPVVSLLNHENSTMQGLKYGFEKVVTWDEYKDSEQTGMIVECPFKTSLAESATNIYVYNEYFNFPRTYFVNPRLFKNLALDNDDRYGAGQEVLINFNMNSLDPVTITVTEGTNTSTITYTPTKMGYQTVTYETKTWNSGISVTLEAEGYDSVTVTGATRNKLFVKLTVNSNTNNINNGTYEISAHSSNTNYNNSQLISATKAEWAEGVEITYNNLTEEEITTDKTTIYFRARTGGNRYGYANCSVKQLLEGTNINIG